MADKYYKNKKTETDYTNLFKSLESEGKLPPQNIELEETLLGTLILDKNAITRIADILLIEDFYRHENRTIYGTVLELFEKGKPIDVMTITNRLKEKEQLNEVGGASYLATLVNKAPASYNCEEYANIIHRKRILRDLIAASYEIGHLGLNETDEIDTVLDQAEQLIFQIAKKKIEKNFVDIKSGLVDAFERIDNLQKNGGRLRGITTGFKQLDNLLGGLQKSDMIVLGARPSIGKSSLALDIARQTALAGSKVAIFSLEMSADQLVDRFIAAEANVDL
jgi:replicative DNA helicase